MISLFRRYPHALVVLLLIWVGGVAASSAPPRPLKRIAHPSTLSLQIVPRRAPLRARSNASPNPNFPFFPTSPSLDSSKLLHSDSFRLTLAAFGETIHLHLRPTSHLIHPQARVNYFRTDENGQSVLDHTVPIRREDVLVYEGEVFVHDGASERRMREDAAGGVLKRGKERFTSKHGVPLDTASESARGWARVMVHDQGDSRVGRTPLWEGAFSLDGVIHHVVLRDQYMRNRHAHDPHPFAHGSDTEEYYDMDAGLVIFRDSDVMSPSEEAAFMRTGPKPAEQGEDVTEPMRPQGHTCSHDRLSYNIDASENRVLRPDMTSAKAWYDPFGMLLPDGPSGRTDRFENGTLVKRQGGDVAGGGMGSNFANTIGQTAGCSRTQKIVYMGVAADCTYVSNYGNVQNATTQIINNWNMASSLYKSTFNVSLGILHIDIQDPSCPPAGTGDAARPWNTPCGSVTLNDRLSLFSAWRGTLGDDGTGLWHLMSGCPTGTEVGVAWLGTLCQQQATGRDPTIVSGAAVSTNGRTEWQVVAHEIGHNFGAIHDCQDGCTPNSATPCCPLSTSSCSAGDGFIMSPVTSSGQAGFSQCSIGNICSLMLATSSNNIDTSCMLDPDPNRQVLSLGMCGNGIVENGEDCDPGVTLNGNDTASPCCDPATCKFRAGAVCDPMSSDCCTGQCQFAPATTVCRPAVDAQCDTQETCTGASASCPKDEFTPNGQSCGDNNLKCANGVCTSPDQQCSLVGQSMGLTRACTRADNTCQLQCQDPSSANVCIQLQAQLIDGSPCGYGGTCVKGNCEAGSFLDTAKAWYLANLQISIPITVVAGIIALMIIWGVISCIRRSCSRRRERTIAAEPAMAGVRGQRIPSWQTPLIGPDNPPPMAPRAPSSHPRRLSVPSSRQMNGVRPDSMLRNVPPSSYGHNPPQSPRGRSWDNAYRPNPQSGLQPNWVDPSQYNGPGFNGPVR